MGRNCERRPPVSWMDLDHLRKWELIVGSQTNLSPEDNRALVLENYCAKESNTNIDDILTIHQEPNGWYLETNQSKELGWVPKDTVKVNRTQISRRNSLLRLYL